LVAQIGTFAVPVFFLVAGFFSYGTSTKRLLRSLRHILFLISIAYGLNFVRIFLTNGCSLEKTAMTLAAIVTPKNVIMWLIFNVTQISGVAWFMFALLYCYGFHYLFFEWTKKRQYFWLIPCLFGCGVVIRIVFPLVGLPMLGSNNAWLCGIPFYLCGQWANSNRERLMEVSASRYYMLAIAGFAVSAVSTYLAPGLTYIGAIALSISLFGLCLKYPNVNNRILSKIGSRYSFFVYIGHPLMIHVFNATMPVGKNVAWAWIRPIALVLVTVVLAKVWCTTWDWIKAKYINQK